MHDMAEMLPLSLSMAQQQVVDLLGALLADAQNGKISGVAVIFTAGPQHFMCISRGNGPTELYTGCGAMQRDLINIMTQKPSSILRAQ
jgi:hypothetical protein